MKEIFILFALVTLSYSSPCQDVISSAGNTDSNSSISLEWTIGDLMTGSFESGTLNASQGFNQSYNTIITSLPTNLSNKVAIYPNPTIDNINIDWSQESNANVELLNLSGQVLKTWQITTQEMTSLDISGVKRGNYYLKITQNDEVNFVKIIRL